MAHRLLLEILTGKHKGRKIRITDPETIIGRGDDAKIRVNSKDVSRHHCMLVATSRGLMIRDLKSSNGTFVNGRPVEGELLLEAGGTLAIGPMMFQLAGDPTEAETESEVKITIQSASQLADSLSDDDIASWLTENHPDQSSESDTAVFDSPGASASSDDPPTETIDIHKSQTKKRSFKSVAEEAQDIIRRYHESFDEE